MTHKCVRCGSVYQDSDNSILKGCLSCGSIFFLYIKNAQDAQELKAIEDELISKDTTLEQELTKSIEDKKSEAPAEEKLSKDKPKMKVKKVRMKKFGIETVRIPKEGVYEINLEGLMNKRPLVILEKERVYFIHLPSAFEKVKERV